MEKKDCRVLYKDLYKILRHNDRADNYYIQDKMHKLLQRTCECDQYYDMSDIRKMSGEGLKKNIQEDGLWLGTETTFNEHAKEITNEVAKALRRTSWYSQLFGNK